MQQWVPYTQRWDANPAQPRRRWRQYEDRWKNSYEDRWKNPEPTDAEIEAQNEEMRQRSEDMDRVLAGLRPMVKQLKEAAQAFEGPDARRVSFEEENEHRIEDLLREVADVIVRGFIFKPAATVWKSGMVTEPLSSQYFRIEVAPRGMVHRWQQLLSQIPTYRHWEPLVRQLMNVATQLPYNPFSPTANYAKPDDGVYRRHPQVFHPSGRLRADHRLKRYKRVTWGDQGRLLTWHGEAEQPVVDQRELGVPTRMRKRPSQRDRILAKRLRGERY